MPGFAAILCLLDSRGVMVSTSYHSAPSRRFPRRFPVGGSPWEVPPGGSLWEVPPGEVPPGRPSRLLDSGRPSRLFDSGRPSRLSRLRRIIPLRP